MDGYVRGKAATGARWAQDLGLLKFVLALGIGSWPGARKAHL